jgi:protein O-mannosyl-transferase
MSRWISRFAQNDRARAWGCAAAIVAAALAAYHNSWHGPFVFDDASSIVTNPTIRQLWPLPGPLSTPTTNVTAQGRPILNLSLALNYAAGGTAPAGYHVVNLLIHLLAGLTLFGLIRRTLQRKGIAGGTEIALAAAVLWTVHPLQTESVTYIIQRAESLVGLFYLLTLYCFVRAAQAASGLDGRSNAPAWLSASVVACLLGMATKEVMATAPLMILFFDRTFVAGTFLEAWRRRRAYYVAVASTWLVLAWLVLQGGGNRGGSVGFGVGIGPWDYWLTQFKAVAHYVWLSVWPHPLVFEYGGFWINEFNEIALPALLVLGLLTATVMALRRRSGFGFLGAWFFGILAPTSLAPGTTQMIVEHRMYLPLAAVVTAAVVALHRLLRARSRALQVVIASAATVAAVLLTVARNDDYRTDLRLWADTVAKRPANPLAHFMLAGAQERAGNIAAAVTSYQRTLDLKPDFSIGHENLGELLLRQGKREDAIGHFEYALRLQPEYPDAHANLGNAYLAVGRIGEAVGHLEKATQLMPASATTHYNYGNALVAAGLGSEAVAEFETALRLDPAMAEAHFNLANVLVDAERPADAIAHYEAAVKARPNYAIAHYNLANALATSGRQPQAVEHYEAALQAQPDYPAAHHNLASALFELGRLPEAASHYEAALALAPDFPNARANLDRVRARQRERR